MLSKACFSVAFSDDGSLSALLRKSEGSVTLGKYYEVLLVERSNSDQLLGYFEDNHHRMAMFDLMNPGLMVRRASYRGAPVFPRQGS